MADEVVLKPDETMLWLDPSRTKKPLSQSHHHFPDSLDSTVFHCVPAWLRVLLTGLMTLQHDSLCMLLSKLSVLDSSSSL